VTEVAAADIQPRVPRSLTSRTFWLAASKSVAYVLNLGVPLVLVRRMSREEYGTYLQAFQIITTAVALLPLGFGMSAYYFLPREPQVRGRVIKNILLVLAGLGGLALVVFSLYPDAAYRLTGNQAVTAYGLLIGLVIFFWVWSGFLETAVLANEEVVLAPLVVVISQLIRTALMLTAALTAADLTSLLLASLAHGVVQSLIMVWYLSSRFPSYWKGLDLDLLKRQVVYASPYSLGALLWVLQSDIHAFFVSKGFGEEQFAIYRVACFQLPFVSLLMESVNAVMIPRVVELQHANRMDELRALIARVVRLLAIAFIPLYLVLLLLSREFITGLFTAKYAESVVVFAVFLTMLPTNVVVFDSVARAFPSLGTATFRLRLVLVPALVLAIWIGTRTLGLTGIAVIIVLYTVVERIFLAVWTAQTLHLGPADYRAMRDVGKVFVASAIAAIPTVAVRQLMSDVPPFIVLVVAGSVFYAAFIGAGFWINLPTVDERVFLKAWYRRLVRAGRS
jgi:O-antigen/teichoic acid export membrane protein